MEKLDTWNVSDSLVMARVDQFPDEPFNSQLANLSSREFPMLPWRKKLTEESAQRVELLEQNLKGKFIIRLVLLHNDSLVGWSFGMQDSIKSATFFMAASLVLPEFRKQGCYSQICKKVIEITKENGFQTIISSHNIANNPIIIAKLKMGFNITGVEVDAINGPIVRLVYHHDNLRRSAAKFRAGAVGESEVLNLLRENPCPGR